MVIYGDIRSVSVMYALIRSLKGACSPRSPTRYRPTTGVKGYPGSSVGLQCVPLVVYSIAIVVFGARFELISRGRRIIFSFKPNQFLQIN